MVVSTAEHKCVFSRSMYIPPFMGGEVGSMVTTFFLHFFLGCGINWLDNDISFISYILSLTVACFVLPLTLMTFCYWKAKSVLYAVSAMNSASTNEDNIGALNADWANQKEITKVYVFCVTF